MKVILIHMPFGPIRWPSIGLSLLSAAATQLSIECEIRYFALDYAAKVGVARYQQLAENAPDSSLLLGEWVFSSSLYGFDEERMSKFLEHVKQVEQTRGLQVDDWDDDLIGTAIKLHKESDQFVESCFQSIAWQDYDLIGFSSTFQQNVASLALAKKIKSAHSSATIAFGGSNWEGIMGHELLRTHDYVDWAISGEGDLAFPIAIQRMKEGESLNGIAGLYFRSNGQVEPDFQSSWAAPVRDLNQVPAPHFDDYFRQVEASNFTNEELNPVLIFETSRGCWWGQKHHCTFCGLNKDSMFYRRKSPEVAVNQIRELVERHGVRKIQMVDDIIDMSYFKTFLPMLIDEDLGLEIFYETKANLTRDQMSVLRDSGVTFFQPGIESLSSSTLKQMDKGVSALQNLRLLKWSRELGLRPIWNILWGFPDEDKTHYSLLPDLIPLLAHLPPPEGAAPISIHRFSPLYESAPEKYLPVESYAHIYRDCGERGVNVSRAAYLFCNDKTSEIPEYDRERVVRSVRDWKTSYPVSDLLLIEREGRGTVIDTRPIARASRISLSSVEYAVLKKLETGETRERVAKGLDSACGPDSVAAAFDRLSSLALIIPIDGKWIALPTQGINIKPGAKQRYKDMTE
ncbi:RiPP maturation radical SAM C-methyltransferase [Fuerstiella marisgermanici]|uniref:Bacteriocin maturation radical SAM protein 1 n=1 Tax=Fuerstiella marisgermanici TaxID=1891926 RepID=A0A1P8WGM5_9PLAN|nr:RiPP maturation radical SAM C-methyltransferase [Fuerstiella marisgermanici]APZ93228.1 bacteriocin maturation radical SAM protein 1 [Fuerstiella marisgermanici]